MSLKKIIPVFLILAAMLALSACILSSPGSSEPSDVNVIVPPGSTVIDPSKNKVDSRRKDSL